MARADLRRHEALNRGANVAGTLGVLLPRYYIAFHNLLYISRYLGSGLFLQIRFGLGGGFFSCFGVRGNRTSHLLR